MLLGIVIVETFALVVLAALCWRLWRAGVWAADDTVERIRRVIDAERAERLAASLPPRIRVRAGWLVIDGLHAASFQPGDAVSIEDGDESVRVECVVGDRLVCSPIGDPFAPSEVEEFPVDLIETRPKGYAPRADPPPGEDCWPGEET